MLTAAAVTKLVGPKIRVTRTTDHAVELQPVDGDFRPFVWFPLKGLNNYSGKLGIMWWLEKRLTTNQRFILELLEIPHAE